MQAAGAAPPQLADVVQEEVVLMNRKQSVKPEATHTHIYSTLQVAVAPRGKGKAARKTKAAQLDADDAKPEVVYET